MGQQVTWLVPHQLAQVLPRDVDYRVMLTFLEFYSVMLQFVLYKLYSAAGARYPPQVHRSDTWRRPATKLRLRPSAPLIEQLHRSHPHSWLQASMPRAAAASLLLCWKAGLLNFEDGTPDG